MSDPALAHVDPHFDDEGKCRCGCWECWDPPDEANEGIPMCICDDCACDGRGGH